MKDLTQGSIANHVVAMAAPIAAGMIFQTLYYLVDLYFVARLGDAAIAGVGAAGNATFIIMGLTQMLGVGTVALVSHAVGRKDQPEANLIFNQSVLLSALCGLITLVGGYALAGVYLKAVAADAATAVAGTAYLHWFIPGLALQFALVAMSSALRGTGIVKPTMVVQVVTVLINVALAPVLIAGWGTGHPMGVAGAGLASSLAIAVGVILLWRYFSRLEKYVSFHPEQWQPRIAAWKRIFNIGLPAGAELALIFVFTGVLYWAIRGFGPTAQAGFGIGSRVMQSIFLPAMAVAFATAPVAGQNFGAGNPARVRETFRCAALIGSIIMAVITVFCQWTPGALIGVFTRDPAVVEVGANFLHLVSWNFVAQGLIFTCSGMFQALGNTWPSLLSSGSRLITYALPAIWLSYQPFFQLNHLWYLSITTVALQALTSLALLRVQLRKRLKAMP